MCNIRVCVTGATGFIANYIVYQLLTRGYIVHATVRSVAKGRKELVENILSASEKRDEQYVLDRKYNGNVAITPELLESNLICFESDLLREGSFKEAIEGCRFVLHTASPFKVGMLEVLTINDERC